MDFNAAQPVTDISAQLASDSPALSAHLLPSLKVLRRNKQSKCPSLNKTKQIVSFLSIVLTDYTSTFLTTCSGIFFVAQLSFPDLHRFSSVTLPLLFFISFLLFPTIDYPSCSTQVIMELSSQTSRYDAFVLGHPRKVPDTVQLVPDVEADLYACCLFPPDDASEALMPTDCRLYTSDAA